MYLQTSKTGLLLTGILLLAANRAVAQTSSPGSIPSRLDNVRPLRQQTIDNNNGSQEFFRQGRDRLYLLPDSNSEPILKIDEQVKPQLDDRRSTNNNDGNEPSNTNIQE